MGHSTKLRGLAAAATVGAALVASVVACNAVLGIEEQGARAVPEDAGDASADSGARPAFEACTRDLDCIAPNGCYTPHCDTVIGACTYALCEAKDRSCARGVCNTSTFACSEPLSYGFLASTYDVPGATSGCGPNPNACVAAVYPFLFVGSRDDVVALRADDLTGKEAIKVPITEPTTKPQQVIASGRRLWVLGEVQGTAPPYQLAIASIDVPSDPTVAALHAQTTVVTYPFPKAVAFPAPNGGLFLVDDDPAEGFPTALLAAPIANGVTIGLANAASAATFDGGAPLALGAITMYRAGNVPGGSSVVASSGSRLVVYRAPSTFDLLADAGTNAAAMQPDLGLNPPIAPAGPTSFAQGPDGTVMIAAPIIADVPGDCNCQSHARLQYVFPNAVATTTDVNQVIDPEVWVNPLAGVCHQCTGEYARLPVLASWLDRRTVLTAAPPTGLAAARTVTDVRLLGRDPLEANPKRSFQTAVTATPKGEFGVDRIALTSSAGIGYLVLADSQGNDVTLSIVDPRCDAVGK